MVGPINRRLFMKCAYCNLSGELLKAIDSRRRFEMNVPRQDNPTANMRREFSSKQLDPDRSAQVTASFLLASSEASNSDTDQALSQASGPQADLSLSSCKAARAFSINRRRTFFSSAADTLASPTT
jgi:hypothetical protein